MAYTLNTIIPQHCAIVPPYILEALNEHADDQTKVRARKTLTLTEGFRAQRMALGNNLEPIARHPGDRRTICDLAHDDFLPGKVVRHEGGPPVADLAVNQAYDNAGITYEFFETVFGRRSIDGKDMRLLSSVHYSKHYDNAFWNGQQMVYGDGDGVVFGSFTNAIDVIAHELTHGVTQMTCGLNTTAKTAHSTSRSPTSSARWSNSGSETKRSTRRTGSSATA